MKSLRILWLLAFVVELGGGTEAAFARQQHSDAPKAEPGLRLQPRSASEPVVTGPEGRKDTSAPLGLREAIELGLARNPGLEAMRRQVELAAGKLRTARTRPYNPELEAELKTDKTFSDEGQREFSLGFSQQLELGGKRRHRMTASRLELEQAGLGAADGIRTLTGQLTETFYRVHYLQQRLHLTREAVAIASGVHQTASRRAQLGDLPAIEASLAEVSREKRAAEIVGIEAELASAQVSLETLLGLPSGQATSVTAAWTPPRELPPEGVLVRAAREARPDLRQRELAIQVTRAQLSGARVERRPDVKVGLAYSRGTEVIDAQSSLPALTSRDQLMTLRFSVPLPIVNRKEGEVLSARAAVRVAQSEFDTLALEVRRQVRDGRERQIQAGKRYQLYASQVVPLSARNLEVTRKAYQTGLADTLQVLKAQDDLNDAKLGELVALWEHEQARIALDTAMGR